MIFKNILDIFVKELNNKSKPKNMEVFGIGEGSEIENQGRFPLPKVCFMQETERNGH